MVMDITPFKMTIGVLIRIYSECDFTNESKADLDQQEEQNLYYVCVNLQYALRRQPSERVEAVNILCKNLRDFDSINYIHENFECMQRLIAQEDDLDSDATLDANSPLGIFIRSLILQFEKYMFDTLSSLSEEMSHYLDAFFQQTDESSQLDLSDMKTLDYDLNQQTLSSQDDRNIDVDPIAKTLYQKYSEAINQRDFESALNALHKYFDMFYGIPSQKKLSNIQDQNRTLGSYAVLSLADLYYRFEHYKDALQAINETIRIAHQNCEHESLAFALAYLFRIVSIKGSIGEGNWLLRRCVQRAESLKMNHLLSSSLLSKVNYMVAKNIMLPPPFLFNLTIKDQVSYNNKMIDELWQEVTRSIQVNMKYEITNEIANTAAITQAGLCETFGDEPMSIDYLESVIFNNQLNNSNSEDYIQAQCRLALLYSKSGEFIKGLKLLQQNSPPAENAQYELWLNTCLEIVFYRCLNRCNFEKCHNVLTRMKSICQGMFDATGDPMVMDVEILKCQLLLRQKQLELTCSKANDCLKKCKERSDRIREIKFALILAQSHWKSTNISMSLKYVLQALHVCETGHEMKSLQCQCYVLLAQIQLQMGMIDRATIITENTAFRCLMLEGIEGDIGDYSLRGQIKILRAKCLLANQNSLDNDMIMNDVYQNVIEALNYFYTIESLNDINETVAVLIVICKKQGKHEKEQQWRELAHELSTWIFEQRQNTISNHEWIEFGQQWLKKELQTITEIPVHSIIKEHGINYHLQSPSTRLSEKVKEVHIASPQNKHELSTSRSDEDNDMSMDLDDSL